MRCGRIQHALSTDRHGVCSVDYRHFHARVLVSLTGWNTYALDYIFWRLILSVWHFTMDFIVSWLCNAFDCRANNVVDGVRLTDITDFFCIPGVPSRSSDGVG